MSHDALSGDQFGEQLQLFMSTDELIDKTHKVDSSYYNWRLPSGERATPREQWEAPKSSKYGGRHAPTLREEKQRDLESSHKKAFDRPYATMPPVELQYHGDELTMMQGHHRLAYAEMHNIPYLAVHYRRDNKYR